MSEVTFCQYCCGPCDHELPNNTVHRAFFVYPSHPANLALTIDQAVRELQEHSSKELWKTWENLRVGGQIIFCEICKAIRASEFIVADITTLNFNVLFELGFAIGLRKAVLPVRDSSYSRDKALFAQVGLFDVLGFESFQNSRELRSLATRKPPVTPLAAGTPGVNRQQPVFYVKSHVDTDGSVKLSSSLKKSAFRFRTFDSRETPRLSLHEAYRQVLSSSAVVAHLMDPARENADIHNSRCAFICGMAMAGGKHVLMLQEGMEIQPIDYRDVVVPYTDPSNIPPQVERLVRATADTLLSVVEGEAPRVRSLLENVDIGDVAAENEIQALSRYFVKTPEYQQAVQGHARLLVGRKGSGKTAVFYAVRKAVMHQRNAIVLDLKPEGHQFKKLKEVVLEHLSEGVQEHLLTAFWTYLLLLEIVKKLIDIERSDAYGDPQSLKRYTRMVSLYGKHTEHSSGDFSERLMAVVNRVIASFAEVDSGKGLIPNITELIYSSEINELNEIAAEYLAFYDDIWLLFDNIDKGWPTRGTGPLDIAILRCLLEATRKLQRSLGGRDIDFKSIVFIRKDIHDLLVDQTPDRGKESTVNLEWSDIELIKELLTKRISESPALQGSFEEVWTKLFDPHVAGEDSFRYIVSRTLLRPRDILNFVRKCIQIAISRGHARVEQDDILSAEAQFSEDMLNDLRYEIRDVFPAYSDIIHKFIGQGPRLSKEDLWLVISEMGVPETQIEAVQDALLWFSFLGVSHEDEGRYSYQVGYNLAKLKSYIQSTNPQALVYEIHPGFRAGLEVR